MRNFCADQTIEFFSVKDADATGSKFAHILLLESAGSFPVNNE
jgi:hypothetical protein